jgi:hypothetical protein
MMMVLSGVTGRNGGGGGDGGGYADRSLWFFLSSPLFGFSLLCFQMFSVFSLFKTIPHFSSSFPLYL